MDDLLVAGFYVLGAIGIFCLGALCGSRDRRRTLPPPSSACDRKYDAGWWS